MRGDNVQIWENHSDQRVVNGLFACIRSNCVCCRFRPAWYIRSVCVCACCGYISTLLLILLCVV